MFETFNYHTIIIAALASVLVWIPLVRFFIPRYSAGVTWAEIVILYGVIGFGIYKFIGIS